MVTSHLPQTISQQIDRLNFPIPQVAHPGSEEIKNFRSLLLDAHNRIRKIYDVADDDLSRFVPHKVNTDEQSHLKDISVDPDNIMPSS